MIYSMPAWAIVAVGATLALIPAAAAYAYGKRSSLGTTGDGVLLGIMAFVLVGLVTIMTPFIMRAEAGYRHWCQEQGGHVDSHTDTVTTVDSKGGVGVGTSTTIYCLSSDGRIIDVQ